MIFLTVTQSTVIGEDNGGSVHGRIPIYSDGNASTH